MIRGTTAQFKFNMPYSCKDITTVVATFWQKHNTGINNKLPIEKTYSNIDDEPWNGGFATPDMLDDDIILGDSKELHVSLNPEETLRFSDKEKAYVQIQACYEIQMDDNTYKKATVASKVTKVTVYPVVNDEPIEIYPPETTDDGIYIFDAGEILGGDSV